MAVAPKPAPAPNPKEQAIKQLRTQREQINQQIVALQQQAKALSALLLDAEGPIPDRTGRPAREVGYTIKPAK